MSVDNVIPQVAKAVLSLGAELPEGMALVTLIILDCGDHYDSAIAATIPPDQFAPVLRRWLERYDAGEAENKLQ